jgi:hypothetical protein
MASSRLLQLVSLSLSLPVVAWSSRALHPATPTPPSGIHAELRRVTRALADPAQARALSSQNPEWLLMANTFTAYALADAARDAAFKAEGAALMDGILERIRGQQAETFFLPYHRQGTWRVARGPAQSVFYLGEVSLALGLRRAIDDGNPTWKAWHAQLVAQLDDVLARSPNGYAESYPNEVWTFCNAIALASLAQWDLLEGTDHGARVTSWKHGMKALRDPATGLWPSAYTLDGRISQGPEGSSIWTAITFVARVDPALAREQYKLATRSLAGEMLGFSFGREWPATAGGTADIDSGLTVLGVGPASTGFLPAAARAVGDLERVRNTWAFLDLVAPATVEEGGARHYLPSNLMGDAVFAFSRGGES